MIMSKPLTFGLQQTVEISVRDEYQTTWPASWKICVQVKKQQLELDMEQQACSKSGKYIKVVYCHLAYLTYMQSTPWVYWAEWSITGVKIAQRNINNLR